MLDRPSVTGAYAFVITPGTRTIFDVECWLYPRVAINKMGVAPLTSMFLFGPSDRRHAFDDFRDAAHDSDGLEIWC